MHKTIYTLALCSTALMASAASATQSIVFEGYTENSIELYKAQEIDPFFVLKSVSFDITYSLSQRFATTTYDPFSYSYRGFIGDTLFGGESFNGEETTDGPGLTGVGRFYNLTGVRTTNLDVFNGTGKLSADLVSFATTDDPRLMMYGGGRSATYRVVYEVEGVSPVPEPKAWLLMLTGFALLGGALRYRSGGMKVATA